MRQRAIAPVVSVLLLVSLTGCGGDDSNPFGDPRSPSSSTDLAVGEVYTWQDGVMASVDGLEERTERGEHDSYPEGHTAFTAEVVFDNESEQALSLSDFVFDAVSAADGAEALVIHVEGVTDTLQGSLEPGASEKVTLSWSLDTGERGREVTVVGVRASSDDTTAHPQWTGTLP
ncbi:hypothetical protein [Streptomyces sp. PT12]|uniref:hypothetical protein n=1 Tax=Streptomyces sp. PT12 TaxID=1510197 RepID=UPI000DE38D98|nr:hypothetical protein [Streptomyces sp. PT12]RBM14408.1 hypothetical protein DEH69_18795 [Streptomyces sp. PT12]